MWANVWLTTATRRAESTSFLDSSLPRTNGIPSVWKYPSLHMTKKDSLLVRCVGMPLGEEQSYEQRILGFVPQVNVCKCEARPHQKAGTREQYDREGNFYDHKTCSKLSVREIATHTLAAGRQSRVQVASHRMECGCK